MDLVVTKWIGLSETARLAREYEEELSGRFPADLLRDARNFQGLLSTDPEAGLAAGEGANYVKPLGAGGIFGALWEAGEELSCGIEAELPVIPLRQETVEICEFYDLNPYRIESSGSLLIGCAEGERMVRILQEAGIHAARIGRTTDRKERVILRREEKRYLTPPKEDDLREMFVQRREDHA